jgi:hypothetical protein
VRVFAKVIFVQCKTKWKFLIRRLRFITCTRLIFNTVTITYTYINFCDQFLFLGPIWWQDVMTNFHYTVSKSTQSNFSHAGARLIWIYLRQFIAVSHYNSNCWGFPELLKPPMSPINVQSQRINHWGALGVRSIPTSHDAVWALWRHVFTITFQSSLYGRHGAKRITSSVGYSKFSSNENARIVLRHMVCECEWEQRCLATAQGCSCGSRVWRHMIDHSLSPIFNPMMQVKGKVVPLRARKAYGGGGVKV